MHAGGGGGEGDGPGGAVGDGNATTAAVAGAAAGGEDAGSGSAAVSPAVTAPSGPTWQWEERGSSIVQINKHSKTGVCRLVVRMRSVLKLLLNTPIFPTAKYEKVGKKSVRFPGVEDGTAEGAQVRLCAFRLDLRSSEQQAKFLSCLGIPTPSEAAAAS
eukprot:NODE_18707_length_880_cov_6.569721.p3 GENE.NODE_18707_length_880_cov_6.569721~~NODE_18707_length_880_cov_6.569721.p3  ORF type:complete len:159 (+),score=50.92 NODE_18707_length_880_cov_6.569721:98-574(+)